MALPGAIVSAVGAAFVVFDALARWKRVTTVLDGGGPSADVEAVERRAKRRELASVVGPLLVLMGATLTVLAL